MTDITPNVHWLIVESHSEGQRIDNFLFSRLKGVPKSRIYRALRNGEFRANKKRITADYRLHAGDSIRIPPLRVATRETPAKPAANLIKLLAEAVIYEDKDIIIVNKPSGIAAHGGSGIHFGVIELLRHLHPKLKFLELVHRLDRDTTGCLMLAKKPSILKELHQLLAHGQVEKTYLALVAHPFNGKERRIKAALQKNLLRSGERVVTVNAEGKPAETIITPLEVFTHTSLIAAKPLTGRTHQIRVHAAHIGHSILGDEKYGDRKMDKALGVKHLLLHAAALKFVMPTSGKAIAVCACLDQHFQEVLKKMRGFLQP
ncbi:MAG TPA: RluA family pseudouridine synthase [Gammaproteobacteria bacterium]|nr:RluA family pseudouridine synthase [Gammaproteobacteria bacterium]